MITSEILLLLNTIYDNCVLQISDINYDNESKAYNACSFSVNKNKIIFRKSKITPKKQGQFVTFWKRNYKGIIQPYEENDNFDFFVVSCFSENFSGQFIFSKEILIQKAIVSSQKKEGKRAFRVYPPWENATNKQAQQSQTWQKEYFISLHEDIDYAKIQKLYFK